MKRDGHQDPVLPPLEPRLKGIYQKSAQGVCQNLFAIVFELVDGREKGSLIKKKGPA
jgi:hypothetical protein